MRYRYFALTAHQRTFEIAPEGQTCIHMVGLSGFYEKKIEVFLGVLSDRWLIIAMHVHLNQCRNSFCVCVWPKILLNSHEFHNSDPNTFSPALCQQRHLCA